ncbi:MAG: BatD family protein [Desulfocapsaceae bacterium]|jgi:hypothetical protein|nr:BatD family protein [Desulfocapsaceae bacterium]
MMRFSFNTPLIYSFVCILSLLLISPTAIRAEDTTVSVELTPKTFSTQQPARLTLTVTGRQDARITMPEVEGLIFHRRGQSSQFQMINGTSSSSVAYTYLVQATEPGDYSIPPITVSTKDGTHLTTPISCTVTDTPPTLPTHKQSQSSAPQKTIEEQNSAIAFIRLIPEKQQTFVGELIPTTIKAYFDQGVKFKFNALSEFRGDGFLMDALGNEPRQQQEIIDGKSYLVLTWDTTLTGIKEGLNDVNLEMDVSMLVRTRQQNQRLPGFGGGLQNDFFDDFFGRYENQPIRLTSTPIRMTVAALPEEGRPGDFSGAIGTFALDINAQPTTIFPGDPITLTMTISGTGNFDNVSPPRLSESAGIKEYTPSISFNPGGHDVEDTKVFEQALVITDNRIRHIPPVVFSYFDPRKEQYRTLFSDPIQIHLETPPPVPITEQTLGASTARKDTTVSPESGPPFAGLAPLKLTTGRVSEAVRPLFKQPLFLLAAALLLAAIAGVTGYRARSHFLTRNPDVVRHRQIERERAACLQSLSRVQSFDQAAYLSGAQQSVRHFLARLWGCKAAAITTADITNHLGSEHPISRLFILCDTVSYGASDHTGTERDTLHKELTETLATLT